MDDYYDPPTPLGSAQKLSLLSTVKNVVMPFRRRSDSSTSSIPDPVVVQHAAKYIFCSDGLRVSALTNFVAICGGEKRIKSLSTRQVVDKYILPITASARSSYCDLVRSREATMISPATVYISHSWGARFTDTLRAIKYHFRQAPDTVIWIDIFSLNQHVFYPRSLRKSLKSTQFGYDDGEYAVSGALPTDTTAGLEAGYLSPRKQSNGQLQGSMSPGGMSVYSDGGMGYGSPGGPAISKAEGVSYKRAAGHVPGSGDADQWNGMHNTAGGAGDWCADILKHGMDAIGSVLLVLNPSPNPEPKSGNLAKDDSLVTHVAKSDIPGDRGPGSPDSLASPRSNQMTWDRSRYTNVAHALSRLWCLYEIYCTTVVREPDRDGSKPSASVLSPRAISRGANHGTRSKGRCSFDIALHYGILVDDEHNTHAGNLKSKRSPFSVDLEATCRDFEHLTRWVCCMDLTHCEASDAADMQRLLHIINVDIGAGVFLETVRGVLEGWVHTTLHAVSAEPVAGGRNQNSTSAAKNSLTQAALMPKQRVYVQHAICKLHHTRGDTVRAEGAMIELGEVLKGRHGAKHVDYIDSLQYLAEFYLQQHRHSDAEPILVECLERRKSALGPQHPDTIHSIDTLANLYEVLGAYHLAEPLFQECFELRKATHGPSHLYTLKSMFSTAAMMFNQEEYTQAEALMRECLDLRRSALGPNHLDTIVSLQKLGSLYEIVHNYPAAELVHHEYLHAVIAVYGTDHVNTINALYLLGTNYKRQHKYALAEKLFRVSAEKYKFTLAPDHECTMRVLYDLAALYEDIARYDAALAVRSSYFALCKAKYGEERGHKQFKSPTKLRSDLRGAGANAPISTIQENDLAQQQALDCAKTHQCMFELARLHIEMGKCVRALPLLQRCLELRQQHVGAFEMSALVTQNLLGYVHINLGNYDEAEQLLVQVIEEGGRLGSGSQTQAAERPPRQASEGRLRPFSPTKDASAAAPPPPVVLDAMSNLGLMYTEQGKINEAEALFMNVWETYRTIHGGDHHPDLLTVVHNLGGLYAKQHKFDLAEFFYTDCLKKRTAVLGSHHPATLHTLCNLAYVYTQLGKYDIAEYMIVQNQAHCQDVLGADHPLTLRHLNNHAANYEAQGQLRQAELLYKQCLVKRRLSQGAAHPETLSSCNNLACLYVKQQQQVKEAERMFKECLKERQRIVGLRHPETLSTINNMATLYLRTGKAELAHDVYIDCTEECVEQLGRIHPVSSTALANLHEMAGDLPGHEEMEQIEDQKGPTIESPDHSPANLEIDTAVSPEASPKAKRTPQSRYEHVSSGEYHGPHRKTKRKAK